MRHWYLKAKPTLFQKMRVGASTHHPLMFKMNSPFLTTIYREPNFGHLISQIRTKFCRRSGNRDPIYDACFNLFYEESIELDPRHMFQRTNITLFFFHPKYNLNPYCSRLIVLPLPYHFTFSPLLLQLPKLLHLLHLPLYSSPSFFPLPSWVSEALGVLICEWENEAKGD